MIKTALLLTILMGVMSVGCFENSVFKVFQQRYEEGYPECRERYGQAQNGTEVICEKDQVRWRCRINDGLPACERVDTPFKGSKIIKDNETLKKFEALLPDKMFDPTLLYSGSLDGWDASVFHAKSDLKGPTMTLFNTNERLLAAYVPFNFTSPDSGISIQDNTLTLYYIDEDKTYNAIPGEGSIWMNSRMGPTFGFGDQFVLSSGIEGNMKLGRCQISDRGFVMPPDEDGNCELTGTISGEIFKFEELEVWNFD